MGNEQKVFKNESINPYNDCLHAERFQDAHKVVEQQVGEIQSKYSRNN